MSASVKRTAERPPSSAVMAEGDPSATIWPPSRMTMRSHSRSASSTSWVTRTTVVPASRHAADDVPRVPTPDGIEVLGELVEEHELGAAHEGEGDEQPLSFAAGQRGEGTTQEVGELPLRGQLVEGLRRRVQRGEQVERLAGAHPVGERGVLELAPDPTSEPVTGGRRVQAEDRHGAGAGASQTLQDLHGRRLPGAVGAQEAEELAAAHHEGHPAQHLVAAVGPAEVAHLDEVIGRSLWRPRRGRGR